MLTCGTAYFVQTRWTHYSLDGKFWRVFTNIGNKQHKNNSSVLTCISFLAFLWVDVLILLLGCRPRGSDTRCKLESSTKGVRLGATDFVKLDTDRERALTRVSYRLRQIRRLRPEDLKKTKITLTYLLEKLQSNYYV